MASTTFVNGTVVQADWLNDVNKLTYGDSSGASMVGFLSSATGAVTRTVQNKLEDSINVLDFIPQSEHEVIKAGTTTYDATTAIQTAIDSGASRVELPKGLLWFSQIVFKPTLREFVGVGSSRGDTYLKRKSGATGAAVVWDGTNRVTQVFIGHFRMDGNSEAAETYGLDLSGFSYCTFQNIWVRQAKLDGIYADGSITPTNKQFSNNTFINVRSNNNLRDGWRFDGSSQANSANTYIGCEGAGNAGIGFNTLVGYGNETVGCTFQGNTGGDIYENGSRNVHSVYLEGSAKSVTLGTASLGNSISARSSYPLWNTFVDNGQQNRVSIRGEQDNEKHLFANPYMANWTGTVPDGITLNGVPTVASYTDTGHPLGASLQLTVGANFQGLVFSLTEPAARLQGKWVTLILEVDTSGVVDTLQTRTYTRDGTTNNGATGEFAGENLPTTTAGNFKVLAYDVKFPASVSGVPTILWYAAYSGVSAGGNIIKIRSAHIIAGQSRKCSQYLGEIKQLSATAVTLGAASNGVNQHLKKPGKVVYDTTAGKLRFATAALSTSPWRATDGSGDLTPV